MSPPRAGFQPVGVCTFFKHAENRQNAERKEWKGFHSDACEKGHTIVYYDYNQELFVTDGSG